MDYLVEVYDSDGFCFKSWRCSDPMIAIASLGQQCIAWKGLIFVNASCYYKGAQQWNLEID